MRLEGSIRLSSRLSLSFPSNNNPLRVLPELDGEAQLRIEWDLGMTQTQRRLSTWHSKYERESNKRRCTHNQQTTDMQHAIQDLSR